MARAEEHRRELAAQDLVEVEGVAGLVEQRDLALQLGALAVGQALEPLSLVQRHHALLDDLLAVALAVEQAHVARLSRVDAAEQRAAADGPVHGHRADAQHLLELVHQLERRPRPGGRACS
jgi:hypothetical protein